MEEKNESSLSFFIREFILSDINKIVEIWMEVIKWHTEFDDEFTLDPDGDTNFSFVLRSAFTDPTQIVYVALYDKEIVGFVYGYTKEHSGFFMKRKVAHVSDIAVKEYYRGKGIGTALMRRFELDFAKKNEASSITLYVHTKNKQGIDFYNKHGFDTKLISMRKKL
jgi:ribosomal protein S18 acetylase RimI-like enzyme